MPIMTKSNGKIDRERVFAYLAQKKLENPGYKVLDIGGSAHPWCDKYVDAYVDFIPVAHKRTFVGDVNAHDVWSEIAKEEWDFCICTHLLEDIRSPDFVINKIRGMFTAGFISMPNKHSEFSHVESKFFLGYSHHRWIFTMVDDELRAIAKMPVVNFFARRSLWYHWACSLPLLRRLIRHKRYLVPVVDGRLRWLNPELAGGGFELAFIWEKDFKFSFINDDFAGVSTDELASLYIQGLARGL